MKGTEGLERILKPSERTGELEDEAELKWCKLCIILDNPELEANEERPEILQRMNRPKSA